MAFVEEVPRVSLVAGEAPHGDDALVLATIPLAAQATRIRDPNDPAAPAANEIDSRKCPRAGAVATRPNLREAMTQAVKGAVTLRAQTNPPAEDYQVAWSAVGEGHAFHVASVYSPDPQGGQVSWRIGSLRDEGRLNYRLSIRNHETRPVKVEYLVYRLNLTS